MTAFTVTLRGDLTTPFGVTPTWVDYTSALELGGDGQPIDVPWGRNDEQAQVEPTVFSFVLNNTNGRFTTGADIISTASRFQVQVTVSGSTYTLATGYVDSVEAAWPGGVQQWSTIRVTCSDVSARLGDSAPLRSFYEHQALAYGAVALYPLSEQTGAGGFGNITIIPLDAGVGGVGKYGGDLQPGADPVIADDVPSVQFGAEDNTKAGAVVLPALLGASGPWTVAVVFRGASLTPQSQTIWQTSRLGPAYGILASSYLTVDPLGGLQFGVIADNSDVGAGSSVSFPIGTNSVIDDDIHVAVCSLKANTRTVRMVLDGVEAGEFADYGATVPMRRQAGAPFVVGGSVPVTGDYAFGFTGRIGMVAVWNSELSLVQAQQLYLAALGFPGDSTDARFSRIAALGAISTSGLPAGQAVMGAQPLSGQPAIEALRTVARTEGSPTFVTGTGALTFQSRGVRYYPTSAVTLTADDLEGDAVVRKDRQGLVNDQTYTRYRGASQRFQDQTSIDLYGRRTGSGGEVASDDFDAYQHAAWDVEVGKTPAVRFSTVTVDLRKQPNASIVQACLGLEVGDLITLTGLPSQTPGGTSTTQYVEGGKLTIGKGQLDAEFYTSPASIVPATLRADGTASARTKLDSGLKIPF